MTVCGNSLYDCGTDPARDVPGQCLSRRLDFAWSG
jgi:hypothetical protein